MRLRGSFPRVYVQKKKRKILNIMVPWKKMNGGSSLISCKVISTIFPRQIQNQFHTRWNLPEDPLILKG